jgi:hypothetical protein
MRVEIMVIAKSDYRVESAPCLDRLDLLPFGWGRQRDGRGSAVCFDPSRALSGVGPKATPVATAEGAEVQKRDGTATL